MTDSPDTGSPNAENDPPQLSELRPATRAIRAGRSDNANALAPLLWATSTFLPGDTDSSRRQATTPRSTGFYSRYGNPGVSAFEDAVAQLENAEAALAFASGMGAVATTILALCSKDSHIVAQRQLFSNTLLFLEMACARFGISVTLVDEPDAEAIAAAVEPGRTQLVFVETPTNPAVSIIDLDVIGGIKGPITVVDSTFASPLGQSPLAHGCDLVLHSATKAIAGHNDATLGVIAGSEELCNWIWGYHVMHGAIASPFDAWNGLRGIRTLSARQRQQTETAEQLTALLDGHDAVEFVRWPGLASHPQHELAKAQMSSFGGVFSFDLRGGSRAGQAFVEACQVAQLAPSLGGPETLVTHPNSSTTANLTPEERIAAGVTDGMVRVSCGLEDAMDLADDFRQALDRVGEACGPQV